MTSKIETWAKESEEARLENVVRSMYDRGYPPDRICEYLCKVATRYLAEMGYDKNGGLGRGEFVRVKWK